MKYLTVNEWIAFPAYSLDGPIKVTEEWECLKDKTIPTSKDNLQCPSYSYTSCKLALDATTGDYWYIE